MHTWFYILMLISGWNFNLLLKCSNKCVICCLEIYMFLKNVKYSSFPRNQNLQLLDNYLLLLLLTLLWVAYCIWFGLLLKVVQSSLLDPVSLKWFLTISFSNSSSFPAINPCCKLYRILDRILVLFPPNYCLTKSSIGFSFTELQDRHIPSPPQPYVLGLKFWRRFSMLL